MKTSTAFDFKTGKKWELNKIGVLKAVIEREGHRSRWKRCHFDSSVRTSWDRVKNHEMKKALRDALRCDQFQ